MKQILKIILFTVFSINVISLQAQEPLELSLDSAVTYAINHNKTLINSKYTIEKSAQKIKETIAQGLPQVNATVDYLNFLGAEAELKMGGSGAPPIIIEFNPTSSFKASASQLIFSGNFIIGVQLSKLAKTITEQSYQKNVLNVKEQTAQAYYTVLVSKRILEIIKENKKNANTIYEKTINMVKTGLVEETDAKKLSVMVTSLDNAVKSTERQLELAYNLLRLQLGLDSNQPVKLSSSIDDVFQKYIVKSMVVDSFNIQNNVDYKLISMQGEIAEKQILMQKANYLPTLAAFYAHTEKIIKPNFDMAPKDIVGLTLSIPIFSSGQRKAKLNQAKIDYDISNNTKDLLTQQLSMAQKQLLFNYKNLFEQYRNQKTNVEVAKEVLDKMQLKYQQGVVSSLELTSANSDYLKAESDYTVTLLKLLNAKLSLQKINNNL